MQIRNLLFLLLLVFISCGKDFESPSDSPTDVFETMWTYFDEHYAYFEYKNIDWQNLKTIYASQIDDSMTEDDLFNVCSNMILELKDGHNCIARRGESVKYDVTEGFDINFDIEIIKAEYLQNDFLEKDNFTYGLIQDSIGYVYYEDFDSGRSFDEIIQYFLENTVSKIILDIRSNGGGDPGVAQLITEHFINETSVIGFMVHKNGKGQQDFTENVPIKASPRMPFFDKKLNVLINRESFSASSYLAGMLHHLENVQLIGQITGGGGGGETSFELPNGWVIGATSNYFLDSQEIHIEGGVIPDIEINNTIEDLENNIDVMLEEAIQI